MTRPLVVYPIDEAQRGQVIAATDSYVALASSLYGRRLHTVPVAFDLTGRAAGMYRVRAGQRVIRFNPYLFAKYFSDNLAVTVPHEVAHYVVDVLYGLHRVRPHGVEWRQVMEDFGADAKASCRYDLDGIPVRRQRRHPYRCACGPHALTTRRHNQVRHHGVRYLCRTCGSELVYDGEPRKSYG